jgi:hypothetical protein
MREVEGTVWRRKGVRVRGCLVEEGLEDGSRSLDGSEERVVEAVTCEM